MPRVRSGIGFGEESSLSEIAEIECIFVPENVEIVVKLVVENYGISYMNNWVFPLRNSINHNSSRMRRMEEKRKERKEEEESHGFLRKNGLKGGVKWRFFLSFFFCY